MTPRIISGSRTSEDILREYYKKQQEEKTKPKASKKPAVDPVPSFQTDESYVLLPETAEHPDLLVSQTRLIYTPSMEQIVKSLKINPQNNDVKGDLNPLYLEGYLGGINYQQAIDLNRNLGGFTLPPNLFVEFLNKLRSGNALDENGNSIDPRRIGAIINDIYEVRNPWRSEWLNHRYSKKENKTLVTYHKFDTSGKLIEVTEELDPNTLEEDKLPGIRLDEWLRNPTSQGLPRKDVAPEDLYYWHPKDGRVARFSADSVGAYLYCYRVPSLSNSRLGVRRAKIVS